MKHAPTDVYLRFLLSDNGIIELRHDTGKRWESGWFTDLGALKAAISERSARGNLYTSLNAPKPRIVANAMAGPPITNADIGWITRLPFDFDPSRPTGCCSTDEELEQALARRDAVVGMLRKSGWPMPLLGMSGNGGHAQYRCRIPNNAETSEKIRAIYSGLALEFGDDEIGFDTKVRNPGRIFRLYGSTNRKGQDSTERPHRIAVCQIPTHWRQVSPQLIDLLANRFAKRQPSTAPTPTHQSSLAVAGRGDYRTLDVVRWFASHGLYRHAIGGNKHSVWCPWREGHSTPHGTNGAIIFSSDGGWPGFFCHHASCNGRGIRDVIQFLGDADAFCAATWTGRARA